MQSLRKNSTGSVNSYPLTPTGSVSMAELRKLCLPVLIDTAISLKIS